MTMDFKLPMCLLLHMMYECIYGDQCRKGPIMCPPGHIVESCEGTEEKCVQCTSGKIQPFNVSLSDDHNYCFNYPVKSEICSNNGRVPSEWVDKTDYCMVQCTCDVANCWAGATACDCSRFEPCGVNQEMDVSTGECRQCPDGKVKPDVGCYPCQPISIVSNRKTTLTGETTNEPLAKKTTEPIQMTPFSGHRTNKTDTMSTFANNIIDENNGIISTATPTTDNCHILAPVSIAGTFLLTVLLIILFIWLRRRSKRKRQNPEPEMPKSEKESLIVNFKSGTIYPSLDRNCSTTCTNENVKNTETEQARTKPETDAISGPRTDTTRHQPVDQTFDKPDPIIQQRNKFESGYSSNPSTSSYPITSNDTPYFCPNQKSNGTSCGHGVTSVSSFPIEHDEELTHAKTLDSGAIKWK